jgi:hypothetical protein
MHGKGEVKGSHWQFSHKVQRLNNDFSHFSKRVRYHNHILETSVYRNSNMVFRVTFGFVGWVGRVVFERQTIVQGLFEGDRDLRTF